MDKKIKKATLDQLSVKVDKLASAVEVGFKRVNGKVDSGFKKVGEDLEFLTGIAASSFESTAVDIARLQDGQSRLEQGQENILLRMDYLAPQFEVKELARRVKRLEDRAGIRHTASR